MKKDVLLLAIFISVASYAADSALFRDPVTSRTAISLPLPVLAEPASKALSASVSTVMRLRHESPKVNGVMRIDHGTGALIDGLVLTARHVVEGPGRSFCEVHGAWIPCRILVEDKDLDIAILQPVEAMKPIANTLVDGCHSSVKGAPVAVLPARKVSTLWMDIQGFHHGASGSPVIQNGRVAAVAVAMRSEDESNSVQIVPAVLLQELWEEARLKSVVALPR